MRSTDLLERLQHAAPFADRHAAERAVEATLRTFAAAAPAPLRRALGSELPAEFAPFLSGERSTLTMDAARFDAEIARQLGVAVGFATEQAEIVCAVLGSLVDPELRARLQSGLDPQLGERFAPRSYPPGPVHAEHGAAAHSLATGRPGGSHPLHEGAPGSQHPVSSSRPPSAQTGSVASEENPHANTKLSSAHGSTQEREHETLAEGRNPGHE